MLIKTWLWLEAEGAEAGADEGAGPAARARWASWGGWGGWVVVVELFFDASMTVKMPRITYRWCAY